MKRVRDEGDILGLALDRIAQESTKKEKVKEVPVKQSKSNPNPLVVKNVPVSKSGPTTIEVDKLTADQLSRYEAWKKGVFSPGHISKMIKPYATVDFNDVHVSMVSACAKILVGDLVKEARMRRQGTGPITSQEIEDASHRLSRSKRTLPDYSPFLKRKDFKRLRPDKVEDFWSMY